MPDYLDSKTPFVDLKALGEAYKEAQYSYVNSISQDNNEKFEDFDFNLKTASHFSFIPSEA